LEKETGAGLFEVTF